MEPLVVSIAQACALLGGTSRSTIYRLIRGGRLEMRKLGSRTFVTHASVASLIGVNTSLDAETA